VYGPPLGFFTLIFGFVIVIVIIKTVSRIHIEKSRAQSIIKNDMFNDYDLRLKKLEERIANIETIVLEQERYRKFSSL